MSIETFERAYSSIATSKNYVKPTYARMDGWAVDRYEQDDGWFAGMMDAGYSRFVGQRDSAGSVIWRVDESYINKRLMYYGITPDEFYDMVNYK
jgi:hypothetical protein